MTIKENHMKQLNEEEVKIYQLGILNTVADFCEKNQIRYWLDSGTLLGGEPGAHHELFYDHTSKLRGAVRYSGISPTPFRMKVGR